MTDATQPTPKEGILQRLRHFVPYFGTLPGTWAMVAVSALVGAATEPMIPALLKPLLDRGFQRGELEIWEVTAALLLLFGVRGLAGYISQLGLTRITHQGLLAMRQAMFAKILAAELKLFSQQSSSALSNTVVYEVQTGATMLVNAMLSLTRNGLTLLALTGYLFYLNWKLTLIVAAIFPAVAWVMKVLTRRVHKLTQSTQQATDQLAYVVEENVLAHRDIRLYAAQASQAQRFAHLSQSLRHLAMKSTVAGAAMTPMTQMLAAVALSAVISVALIQSADSGTSVGGFVAFVTAMLMIIAPVRQLSEVSSPITRGLVALERALALIEQTPDESSGQFAMDRASGALSFSELIVQYPSATEPALHIESLTVKPGQTVALVGTSGSGKTTLVNVLTRFVDITSGRVTVDNHELKDWNLPALRAQFSLVSQQVVMINDSVAANVALGLAIDRDRVLDCL
ncbi:MAG: lipid ABC transporter permease/ATP-binding protein, partial [Comamonadaceae bacterium CG_4_9_14_0_8_um_filter_60_18]